MLARKTSDEEMRRLSMGAILQSPMSTCTLASSSANVLSRSLSPYLPGRHKTALHQRMEAGVATVADFEKTLELGVEDPAEGSQIIE